MTCAQLEDEITYRDRLKESKYAAREKTSFMEDVALAGLLTFGTHAIGQDTLSGKGGLDNQIKIIDEEIQTLKGEVDEKC